MALKGCDTQNIAFFIILLYNIKQYGQLLEDTVRNWKRILVAVALFAALAATLTACSGNWTGGPVTVYGGATLYGIASHGPDSVCGTVPATVTVKPVSWHAPDPDASNPNQKQTQASAIMLSFNPGDLGIGQVPSGWGKGKMKYNLKFPGCTGSETELWVNRSKTSF
jgi:hypothetical protein